MTTSDPIFYMDSTRKLARAASPKKIGKRSTCAILQMDLSQNYIKFQKTTYLRNFIVGLIAELSNFCFTSVDNNA